LKVSVIDLGYNSLKLVNYQVNKDKSFSAYGQKSILPRLGEGLDKTGILEDQPINRTIRALKLFRDIVNTQQVDHVLPIATSAVREAGNKQFFLKEASVETGFGFKVLSEREEAIYSYAGARAALHTEAGIFFDLGGGSLEIVYFEHFAVKKILSLPLGGLRLTDLYSGRKGGYSKKNYARMRKRILGLLPANNTHHPSNNKKLDLIGVGGTVRAMARFEQIRDKYPINKLHNYEMDRDIVESIHESLRDMTLKEIKKIPAIGQDRARSIVAGSLVVSLLMNKFNFRKLIVSTHGLRDGVLAAFLDDPISYRTGNVDRIVKQVDYNSGQKTQSRLSSPGRVLLESINGGGVLTSKEYMILLDAINKMENLPLINPEAMFYVVLENDSVLSHTDQLVMALALANAQGMKRTDWLQATYQDLLDDDSEDSIDRLASIIRLADILNKTHSRVSVKFIGRRKLKFQLEHHSRHFPEELYMDILKDFKDSFDIKILN
jgi:exopolyphosphatase/guanosine-5'-triphosphate,3'-diphosphate pyrophosphatase